MTAIIPEALDPWIDVTFEGWKLKKDAPPEIQRIYEQFMKLVNEGMIDSELPEE